MQVCVITPKALANTFGVIKNRFARFPRVVAALQPWAEIRERLRRKTLLEKQDLKNSLLTAIIRILTVLLFICSGVHERVGKREFVEEV
jgi:hypothetical protein